MMTRGAQFRPAGHILGMQSLCEIIAQSELSGARRNAAVLFMDRLPPTMAKPHHLRLAKQALDRLVCIAGAQVFELSQARVAVVWRGYDGTELDGARRSLEHLLSDQPDTRPPCSNELLRGYDLPHEAARLLDDLAKNAICRDACSQYKIDLKLLAGLEATLAQADLACFARIRPIMALHTAGGLDSSATPVWDDRYFDIDDLATGLSPGRDLQGDRWLFGRLTRTLDMRMLALLSAPGQLARHGPFAISVNVSTILSPTFLRFDGALPTHLRGEVILTLRTADILADSSEFALARNFARARSYRLALANVTPRLLELLDVAGAGIDLLNVALTPALREEGATWRRLVPPGSGLILTDITRPSELRWAVANGFRLGRGALFSG